MSGYLYFFICLAFLIAGYAVYGVIAEKVFGVDRSRPTPVMTREDGVDYVKMPLWKMIVIQLLNIAGLGPVFGPIIGALYGPSALLWVVFGCVLGGAVHDYMSGMISSATAAQATTRSSDGTSDTASGPSWSSSP